MNEGDSSHTASAEDGEWGTGTLAAGKHFSRYFDEAGDYDYYASTTQHDRNDRCGIDCRKNERNRSSNSGFDFRKYYR